MPKLTIDGVLALAAQTKGGALLGRLLDPVPRAQTQEGPTCGFYALSIVMDYWKAAGRTNASAPARARDVELQNRDKTEGPSLRNLGKAVGALDQAGVAKASTGGVFTAKQLAAVAKAVKFANFNVRIKTARNPHAFVFSICDAINSGVPPIVAFDVRAGDPVPDGGQSSHWGVIIGYFNDKGVDWLVATHGHGGYYLWQAYNLQQANFSLASVRHLPAEEKIRLVGQGTPETAAVLAKYQRTQWEESESAKNVKAMLASPQAQEEKGYRVVTTGETRPAVDISQDLAHHILLVEPS
jgi:hypothetical protein